MNLFVYEFVCFMNSYLNLGVPSLKVPDIFKFFKFQSNFFASLIACLL